MPILNYTTSISAEKTVSEIQKCLCSAGAKAIMTQYDDEQCLISIAFQIDHDGQNVSFVLPAKIDKIYIILQNDDEVTRKLKTREQASRVCWRIIKAWIEAQMALIEADQANLVEVFLPYAQDHTGQTVYQKLEKRGFAGLLDFDAQDKGSDGT